MADFKIAFRITGGNEGGWQNDPHDTGNSANGLGTYRGIASAKQPGWKGWPVVQTAISAAGKQPVYGSQPYKAWVVSLNGVLSANEALQALVQSFYKSNFWDVNRLDDFISQEVANKVYDSGVNQGTGTSAMILQKCLGVMPDGNVGPVTISSANKMDGTKLAEDFKQARIAKYKALVVARPEYSQYLTNWISRC